MVQAVSALEVKCAQRSVGAAVLAMACLWVAGCTSETILLANFKNDPVGGPPGAAQAVGTTTWSGATGSVVVDGPLAGSSDKWVRINRAPDDGAPISIFQGNFSRTPGPGSYGMLAALLVPSNLVGNNAQDLDRGSASVELRPLNDELPYLLHLDFLPKQPPGHMIRINDDPTQTFGQFPVDQPFTLSIALEVASSSATAHVTLLGSGVSTGTQDIPIPNAPFAAQLGAARFWIGWPWRGAFDATDIVVTYKKQ